MVVIHSCQSSAQAYFQNSLIPWHRGSDNKGYITVWPSSPHSGTCWDVSSKATLTHGGGGDTQAISNMITYAISQYKVDASRVFVTGGSSGGKCRSTWTPSVKCHPVGYPPMGYPPMIPSYGIPSLRHPLVWASRDEKRSQEGSGLLLCRDRIRSFWLTIMPISSHDVQCFSGDIPRADQGPFAVLRGGSWVLLVVLWGSRPVEFLVRIRPSERHGRGLGECCEEHVPRL